MSGKNQLLARTVDQPKVPEHLKGLYSSFPVSTLVSRKVHQLTRHMLHSTDNMRLRMETQSDQHMSQEAEEKSNNGVLHFIPECASSQVNLRLL